MMRLSFWSLVAAVVANGLSAPAVASEQGLKDIKHIVLFMQENRAFDHYFGTMEGVRGFQDPNVHISKNTGKDVFHQPVDQHMKSPKPPKDVTELLPWYLNYQGGEYYDKTQCMVAGTNDWRQNHEAWNKGEIDRWATANTPYSIGYYRRSDLPIHFGLAGNFTVADTYYESVIASTDPNRVSWFSGTINVGNSAVQGNARNLGGPVIDNNRDPRCLKADNGSEFSCRPLKWKTVPEYLQESGISFQVYQDFDNFGDNTLVEWKQYQEASAKKTDLAKHAVAFPGLAKFFKDAEQGNLPEVSYIVAPMQLSEHPPFTPNDGAWIQRKVAEAVMHGKNWDKTALIYSYDETGGWADHVMSPHPPKDSRGEWMIDPYNKSHGMVPTGPGFRLPFYIVSPWTRNGGVFTEHSSHESQILFLEEWSKAVGKPFHSKEINEWRRKHMSNLVKAFDFSHADTSMVQLEEIPKASQDAVTGAYNGATMCQLRHVGLVQPKVPYGKQNEEDALRVESGYKPTRGDLTEGRLLSFEANGYALAHGGHRLGASKAQDSHNGENQLFVIYWQGSAPKDNRFLIGTAGSNPRYLTSSLKFTSSPKKATEYSFVDQGNGQGYTITETHSQKQLSITKDGSVAHANYATFTIYSVTK
ncbi:phospholipase C [Malassezia japonica]|uniref:Phospholipase C n=1 Tax=Malassezia japonica TaxID=223818 RepID=A0AAF0F5U3_9BASI|nr:phospholipase C [Malassezia japonica]WFD41109.1 phospholipase C [Malassezia japonica]